MNVAFTLVTFSPRFMNVHHLPLLEYSAVVTVDRKEIGIYW